MVQQLSGRCTISTEARLLVLDELAGLQFVHSLVELGLGVHHDGAVPCDRLFERLAGDEQEADAFGAGLDDNFISTIEQNERVVFRVVLRGGVRVNG